MKKLAPPLLTLVAVAVLGAGLLTFNVVTNPANQQAAAPAAAAGPPAAEPAPAAPAPVAPAPAEPAVEPPAVAELVYAGRSSGNEVTVAIAVLSGRAVAYVCDGDEVEAWLEGTLEGDRLSLAGKNGAAITGTVDGDASFGTVGADGKSWPYSAKGVAAPEGLYEGRSDVAGVADRIGWIVLDGTQIGGRQRDGDLLPAPELPIGADALTVDGQPFTVRPLSGGDDVVVGS